MATALSSLANTNTSSSTKPKSGTSSSLPVEEVNQNLASESPVQQIVSAVGQIADAVQGISREVQSSTCMVAETVERTQESEKSVRTLIDSAQSIGQVVGLIESVAAKINMLALNATIEAARAGDSGKGFAVVAGEVKNLANQTAQATQTIKNKIASVQSTTQEVIDSLHGLSEAVSRVNENCTTIAASTEEQTAMLSDMTSQAAAVSAQFYMRDTMRLVEMAQTLVQLIVRNLYERTADCRWWATDDAFCSCLQSLRNPNDIGSKHRNPNQSSQTSSNWISRLLLRKPALETQTDHSQVQSKLFAHASDRLAIINRFYSVYLNLVLTVNELT